MGDLAGAPQELINTTTGTVEGRATQTFYGTRTWSGRCTSPLLFVGQYEDAESGWAYNRFRYYSPTLGAYNAQDPLGLAPRLASAQGYVDHAAHWVDVLGLIACQRAGKSTYDSAGNRIHYELLKQEQNAHYTQGIHYKDNFPIFDDHVASVTTTNQFGITSTSIADVSLLPEYQQLSQAERNRILDEAFGISQEYRSVNRLTWHHHQETGRIQLAEKGTQSTPQRLI
ncbi:RHS repeat-associated core domain-containing protein [Corynebacterium macclintockiae]|uniref:RHS repeat-associated core domain-containing protein n=1 Tax=Corynebacterium TaxID=1716 RepID=UPI001DC9AE33|nr:RHS repeat-associated core domain-containing protein [Corynebacterium macclintockiae]MBC6795963.1 hypothetical protein [Corynebacterium sp. LK28]MDK8870871.1 RHS repeat-associated core domain-containing protein [Corynebacterium macclintockiae]